MDNAHVSPEFDKSEFNCPFCSTYAWQIWYKEIKLSGATIYKELSVSRCLRCEKQAVWLDGEMLYPDQTPAPVPNPDLPEDIKDDYREAMSVATRSPRSAAALLRLCVQKLCAHVGENAESINEAIRNLVKKGSITVPIQRALDTVRITGNNAVHPGQMDLRDNKEIVFTMFRLVNYIAEFMLTMPREIGMGYDALPDGAKKSIVRRDQAGQASQPEAALDSTEPHARGDV